MANSAPVNVKLEIPTNKPAGWDEETSRWLALNREIGGNPDFFPLTIKGAYIIGVIHTLCESVSILLKAPNTEGVSFIPALGVFSSGIELLGRCLRGNSRPEGSTADLQAGYKWLAAFIFDDYKDDYKSVPLSIKLIKTKKHSFSISELVALRHFAAHGQATSQEVTPGTYAFGEIDFEILEHMPPLLAHGLEVYWSKLEESDELCNMLAAANVIALRGWPINQSWLMFAADPSGKHLSITEIFTRFNWKVS